MRAGACEKRNCSRAASAGEQLPVVAGYGV